MKLKSITIILIIISISSWGQNRPRYGCQFLQAILTGIDNYKIEYKEKYDSIVDRGFNPLWFDDQLFHFDNVNYVVDTFGFFGPDCNVSLNNLEFRFLSSFPDTSSQKMNVFAMRSLCIGDRKLVLIFRHPKSDWNIRFEFRYNHCRPELQLISREEDEIE